MAEEAIPQNEVTETDAPAPEPEAVDPFAWMDKEQRASYFNRDAPDHPAMVQAQQNRLSAEQKKADAAELDAMGGTDAVPLDEQTPQVELPELSEGRSWDEGAAATAIAVAEQAGVPTELVQEAFNAIAKTGAPPCSAEEGEKRLRVIFGDNYDAKVEAANAVLDDFPALKEWIIGSPWANDPGLIVFLASKAGQRGDVQQEIKTLSTSEAYLKGSHPDHEKTIAKVQKLYQKLYRGGE